MIWNAYFINPMTGDVGKKLRLLDGGDWDIEINKTEMIKAVVAKKEISDVDRSWWTPWQGGILVTCTRAESDVEEVIAAGPITDPPDETRDTATFKFSGIRAFFTKRILLNGDYYPGYETDLAKKSLKYTGMSLGTIAKRIVARSLDKPAGNLPIVYGSPSETGSHLNERTYENWNIANNMVDKRLTELSEVINGPDIMFRPRWTDDTKSRIEWVMVHGTAIQPMIAQKFTGVIDTTSDEGIVIDYSIKTNASHMANRVYWTGSGEGSTTLIAIAQDTRAMRNAPILEIAGADNDTENFSLIKDKARAAVEVGKHPLVQVSVDVNTDNDTFPMGQWFVGDLAEVKIGGSLVIPDGTYSMRIIAASGDIKSSYAKIEFQEEVV